MPAVDRFIEATRYRLRDRASDIADANLGHLRSMQPYDLVFAHDVPVMPLAAGLKDAWACRVICDLHEVFPEQDEHFTTATARRYWRSIESTGLAAADGIICVNSAVAEYVRATHATSAPMVVIHNSVPFVERSDLRGPTLRDYYDIPEQAKVMLFAGSLRPHKNIETLLEGFARARLDGWVLALLGDGPIQAQLQEIAQRSSMNGSVFLGHRAPQHELIRVTSSADLGLLPYQSVGFNYLIATPNKLFEYIQARLPIATSRLPMIEQILARNGNGGFVDFSGPASTATDLRRFVSDGLQAIAPDALEAAAHEFSWEREEASLFSIVSTVMPAMSG
jgi:glycosyltransferase involved in cell wall biosynthesis